jgi:AcrR family transcriptional regulator
MCLRSSRCVFAGSAAYGVRVPKLWDETIEAHRRQVRDAILDTTATLVFDEGLRAVTMSRIAETTGIGRATLYKYFPDVEAILHAWHAREIDAHLAHLAEVRDRPGERLEAVLKAYALIVYGRGRHDTRLVRLLHHDEHVAHAERRLHDLVRDLLAEGAGAGALRADVPPDELAGYCLHALGAATDLPSEAAVHRLVKITLAGLRSTAQRTPGVHATSDGTADF